MQQRLCALCPIAPDSPLLLPPEGQQAAASDRLRATSAAALIGAGNDVNVTLCRATGDFFRAWGMPGARFDARTRADDPGDQSLAAD